MADRTDSELVQAACLGDKRAFEQLIARHQPVVHRLAARMVTDAAVAQELVQEALLEAYLCLADLRNPASFSSWLCGIALNTCRSYLRNRRLDFLSFDALAGGLHFDALLFTSGEPSPHEMVETQELHALVMQAVESLSPKNRDAVLLFYYEQLNLSEISALLGISVAAVKGRLHKSRAQLRGQLASLYQEPTPHRYAHTEEASMITVSVMDVVKQADSGNYVIVLLDEQGGRILPIWVGSNEALNIVLNLLGQETGRPMTYRFMANVLTATEITLQEVHVSALQSNTFYAVARFLNQDQPIEIDARPSDAIALALHVGCPIYVDEEVMASAGVKVPDAFQQPPERTGLQAIGGEFQRKMEERKQGVQGAAERSEAERQQAQQALLDTLFGAASHP